LNAKEFPGQPAEAIEAAIDTMEARQGSIPGWVHDPELRRRMLASLRADPDSISQEDADDVMDTVLSRYDAA